MAKIKLVPTKKVHQKLLAQNPKLKKLWEANAEKRAITDSIIEERIKQNMTQEKLATAAGMKRPSLARIENGNSLPTITTLSRLAKAFGKKLEVKFVNSNLTS